MTKIDKEIDKEEIFATEFLRTVKVIFQNAMKPLTINQIAKILIIWGWPGDEENPIFIKDIQDAVDKIKTETYYK